LKNVVIVTGVRTPIGRYGGSLRDVPVYKFTSLVLNEAVKKAKIEPAWVDDVIMGQSYQNGDCANGARMALLEAGWPHEVPGVTLDRRCCSGLDAIFFGVMKIQTGNADIIVAGGMESMSQAELYLHGKHEPGRALPSRRYQVGFGRKSGFKMGIYAKRTWQPFYVGNTPL